MNFLLKIKKHKQTFYISIFLSLLLEILIFILFFYFYKNKINNETEFYQYILSILFSSFLIIIINIPVIILFLIGLLNLIFSKNNQKIFIVFFSIGLPFIFIILIVIFNNIFF